MAEQKTNQVREIRLRRLRALTKPNAALRSRVTRAADFEAARHRACLVNLGQNVDAVDGGNGVVDSATACHGAYDDTNPVDENGIAARITSATASRELALLEEELGLGPTD